MALAAQASPPPKPSPKQLSASTVKSELERQKAQQEQLTQKTKKLESELSGLKKRLLDSTRAIRTNEEKLGEINRSIRQLNAKKEAVYANLSRDQRHLGDMISAFQKLSRTPTGLLLIGSESPLEAARASMLIRASLPLLHEEAALLKEQLNELESLEKKINRQLQSQQAETRKLEAREKELAALLAQRESIYKDTQTERQELEDYVKRLASQARDLEDLVKKLKPQQPPARGGQRPPQSPAPAFSEALLPVQGTIATAFGGKDALGGKNQGITIAARSGATVISPLAGTVKFAGPFQKFRQILIVEHSGGYHSLIAGLERIDTVVGAKVSAGEPVGKLGSSSEPRLYYELRLDGKPINPEPILIARTQQGKRRS